MKKFVAGIALAVMLSPINSQAEEITNEQLCTLMALSAKKTMEARQTGMTLTNFLEFASNMELPDAFKKMMRALALEAYDSPRYSTDKNKLRAINEFENQVLLGCLKELK